MEFEDWSEDLSKGKGAEIKHSSPRFHSNYLDTCRDQVGRRVGPLSRTLWAFDLKRNE